MIMVEAYPAHQEKDVDRALGMLDGFLDSDLWKDLQEARQVLPEHPITWKTEDGTVARGTIDLLFQSGKEWYLIDYKTDAVESTVGLEDRLVGHPYTEQVRIYASAWEEITGSAVAESGLWFADPQEYLECSAPQITGGTNI
jgi:ATP-dependent exoDNAse (exonuclease V) beta subunit